jgi:hypothetical protein
MQLMILSVQFFTQNPLAYLFIMGILTPAFDAEKERRRKALTQKLAVPVAFEIVGQNRIAELYSSLAARNDAESTSSARDS